MPVQHKAKAIIILLCPFQASMELDFPALKHLTALSFEYRGNRTMLNFACLCSCACLFMSAWVSHCCSCVMANWNNCSETTKHTYCPIFFQAGKIMAISFFSVFVVNCLFGSLHGGNKLVWLALVQVELNCINEFLHNVESFLKFPCSVVLLLHFVILCTWLQSQLSLIMNGSFLWTNLCVNTPLLQLEA